MACEKFLQPGDFCALMRFCETTEDEQDYDIPKDKMNRLAEIGVVRRVCRDRYQTTSFGDYVIAKHRDDKSYLCELPLKTMGDRAHIFNKRLKKMVKEMPQQLSKENLK